jgi:metalloendopeptidase OMA1, mitochondrial
MVPTFRLSPRRLWGIILFCGSLSASVLSAGCEGGNPSGQGEGPGRRAQALALTPKQELLLGRRAYQEILNDPEKYGRVLPADSPQVRRVRAVAERIIQATQIEPLMREINLRKGYRYEWEVNVFDKNTVNAFCLPGGKIGVFEGLLRIVQNDDQLAVVLSHEIAHALAHHSSERLAREGLNRGGGGFWGKAYDRAQESEADHIGLFFMTFAGYNPDEAVPFWERMERLSHGREVPEILSDHPSDEHRIRDIEKWIPMAKAAKKAYDEGNIAPP